MELPAATVEHVLQAPEALGPYLTPAERAGGWRIYFGQTATRVPAPFWLYAEDERTVVALAYPFQVTAAWEALARELGRLLVEEARYRVAVLQNQPFDKQALMASRVAWVEKWVPLFTRVLEQDLGRLLPEILWLALSRECAQRFTQLPAEIISWQPGIPWASLARVVYLSAQRVAELCEQAEQQATRQLRQTAPWVEPEAGCRLGQLIRQDLLPLVSQRPTSEGQELDWYLAGTLGLEPFQFRRVVEQAREKLDTLRRKDPSFDQVAGLLCEEAPSLSSAALLFHPPTLRLLASWPHPSTPRLSAELFALLEDLGGRLRRFEVVASLRARVLPVTSQGTRLVTRTGGQVVSLSPSTRPLDFTSPSVLPSAVRRFGLVYDLVDFSEIVEQVRRRGQRAELMALYFLLRFQHQWENWRRQYRLRLEKFLGDGAFFSARRARAVLAAATHARLAYEKLREEGCPFDRGLRMACNVGTYHLMPMLSGEEVRFEFFGPGLVELSRLTTGKSAKEVEDIAEFLVARGYELHRVLQFLEPVRSAARAPADMEQRPSGAYLLEGGQLQNLGTVVTEAFLRELELEWTDAPVGQTQAWGLRWLVLPVRTGTGEGPWAGVRFLGVAHLKGLEPSPLYELVAWEQAPAGVAMLPPGTPMLSTLRRLSEPTSGPLSLPAEIDPQLCVVSAVEDDGKRAWYLGLWQEELDALISAFRVPLVPAAEAANEPLEAWLFRQRQELAKLYHALRRDSAGATLPLAPLRHREGYLACLLCAPQRSPR